MKEADRLQTLMDRLLTPQRLPQLAPLNIHEVLERVRSLVLAEFPTACSIRRDYDVSLPAIEATTSRSSRRCSTSCAMPRRRSKGSGEIVLRTRVARQVTLARKLHRLAVMCRSSTTGLACPRTSATRSSFRWCPGAKAAAGWA